MLIYLCAIEGQDEKQKFEIIYEEYKNLMFYVANRILEDTQDSEDIVHQAFLKIIEIIDQIEEVKCPQTRSLVVTIVKRKAIDLYRARRRHGSLSLDDDNLCCGIAAETEYVDERMMIAQAIAALAYGTEMIPKVDKIVGPGNIFVALAKRAVYGHVSIDSIAGPSEILVLADESATPRYVAADLLSQAEHDELASAILITTSEELAKKVSDEVDDFVKVLERKEIIQKSLDNYGYILVAPDMETAIEATNEIASEHLEILTKNPFDTMTKIRNAGAIFLGEYSSEPLVDYYAGPNHVLPTNGTAKFFSPLNVDDYVKKSSIISYSREALEKVHEDIELFAKKEGLTAHANSIHVRFE